MQELAQPLQREEFGLERDQDRSGGNQRIDDGEQVTTGAIPIQANVPGGHRRRPPAQLAPSSMRFDLRAGRVDLGRRCQAWGCPVQATNRLESAWPVSLFVARLVAEPPRDPETGRGIALRVEIDEQDPPAGRGERGGED